MSTTKSTKRAGIGVTHAGTGRICSECRNGKWSVNNFNYNGEPFLIYCEYSTYAYNRRMRCGYCYGNTAACKEFIAGEKPDWRKEARQ